MQLKPLPYIPLNMSLSIRVLYETSPHRSVELARKVARATLLPLLTLILYESLVKNGLYLSLNCTIFTLNAFVPPLNWLLRKVHLA